MHRMGAFIVALLLLGCGRVIMAEEPFGFNSTRSMRRFAAEQRQKESKRVLRCDEIVDAETVVRAVREHVPSYCWAPVAQSDSAIAESAAVELAKDRALGFGGARKVIKLSQSNGAETNRLEFAAASAAYASDNGKAAEPVLLNLVEREPQALLSAELLAAQMARLQPAEVEKLCKELLTDRPLQAMACARGGGKAVSRETRLSILAAQSSLTVEQVQAVLVEGPSGGKVDITGAIQLCQSKTPLQLRWKPVTINGSEPELGMSTVLSLLANETQDEQQRECLVALSASACVAEIHSDRGCQATLSLVEYARNVFAKQDKAAQREFSEPEEFIGALFVQKGDLYLDSTTPLARQALLQLHLALAQIYKAKGKSDRFGHDWKWHLNRAKIFWQKLDRGEFPAVIEEQINPKLGVQP